MDMVRYGCYSCSGLSHLVFSISTMDEGQTIHHLWTTSGYSYWYHYRSGVFDIETVLIGLSIQTSKNCCLELLDLAYVCCWDIYHRF